jgi:hypothetical protein
MVGCFALFPLSLYRSCQGMTVERFLLQARFKQLFQPGKRLPCLSWFIVR